MTLLQSKHGANGRQPVDNGERMAAAATHNEREPLLGSRQTAAAAGRAEGADDPADGSQSGVLVLILPALLIAIIVKAFDVAFLQTSYSRLASDLQHFKDASWIVLTTSICSAIFVPLYSYLLKSFGIRRMMYLAFAAFTSGVGLCAASTSFWQLLASRFVVGFGSSGLTLLEMVIINEIVGIRQLGLWESFVCCIEMGTSTAAGPLGAWMYRQLTWHSVFYLELISMGLGIVVLYVSFWRISSNPEHAQSTLLRKGDAKVPRVDMEGWILLVLAATVPLVAFTLGDNFLAWTHPAELLLLISGPILVCGFVLFEAKVAVAPIVDMTPVFKLDYLEVLFQVFGVITIYNSVVFVIPPYIQVRAFDGTPFLDWALTCVFLGFPAGAIFGGYLVKAGTFPVRRMMLTSALILLCFCGLFATRVIKPEMAQHAPLLVGFGACVGVWQSCLLFATLSTTERQWWPQTLAMYYLVETVGTDLGVAAIATIMRTIAKAGIRSRLGQSQATEQIITDAMRDLETVRSLQEGARDAVLGAFEVAIHKSFLLPCALAVAIVVAATSMNVRRWNQGQVDKSPDGGRAEACAP